MLQDHLALNALQHSVTCSLCDKVVICLSFKICTQFDNLKQQACIMMVC